MADTMHPSTTLQEPFSERMAADSELASSQSAYDKELQQYTESLSSRVTDFYYAFGRRYHARVQEAGYPLPNDEREHDRLDLQHKMYEVALFGALFLAPIENPRRILDLATGTGIWAIEVADKFPDAEVIGNDISPIQPRWVPPNVHFEVDDIEQEWVFHEKFDFIHSRALHNAIRDWPTLIKRSFANLQPGGWAEFVDFDINWHSPDASLHSGSPLWVTGELFIQAVRNEGMEPCPGPQIERWMREAGYADIHVTRIPIPLGTWPADHHLKEIGAWHFLNFFEHYDAFITYILNQQYGYSKDDCDAMSAMCRNQMRDPKTHVFMNLYITYGQRPIPPT